MPKKAVTSKPSKVIQNPESKLTDSQKSADSAPMVNETPLFFSPFNWVDAGHWKRLIVGTI